MAHDHNHDHEHEERELITLVDEQGNETLFEILLTIDGKEEFGKIMSFLYQLMLKKMKMVKLKFKHTHSQKMKMELKVTFSLFQKTLKKNGI